MVRVGFFFTNKKCIENVIIMEAPMPILMATLRAIPEGIIFDLVASKIDCGVFYEAELEPCFLHRRPEWEEFSHFSVKRIRVAHSLTWITL